MDTWGSLDAWMVTSLLTACSWVVAPSMTEQFLPQAYVNVQA